MVSFLDDDVDQEYIQKFDDEDKVWCLIFIVFFLLWYW